MPARRRKPPRSGALNEFPPRKIIRSILLLQLCYYLIAAVLIAFTTTVAGQSFRLALVFDWRTVRGDNTVGWLLGVVWLCVALFAVMILLFLISRSKLVPDFALTLHFLHLVTTSFYTRTVPTNVLWWGLQAASAGVMVGLGVWACRYRELKPISFGVAGSTANDDNNRDNNKNTDGDGTTDGNGGRRHREGANRGAIDRDIEGEESPKDEVDDEHVRGGGRYGRGRNRSDGGGGPSYEMVGLGLGLKTSENGEAV